MSIETELKLRMDPEQLAKLRRHKLFRAHQITAPASRRLHNIYYDTPELELHKNRMALRLRRVGGQWLQTLKGGGQVLAGLHQRYEWEVPVPSAKLDFSGLDEAVWEEHLPRAIRCNLKPVFITDFYRSSRLLNWAGAIIEVCMDHGEVKTSGGSAPICEVELELKSGEPQKLFELAQAILEIVSFELEEVSKAELGFRLLAGYIEQPEKGSVPKLAATDSLTDGLQTLIWSCLSHLQGNLRGAMEGRDPEYLHQMRVALRRLRVVLRLTEKVRADEELAALRKELAGLGVNLGRIREWDVFIEGIRCMPARHAGLQALLAVCERQRAECYAALISTVLARELQHLLLRFSVWMSGSYWRQAEQGAPETHEFATRHLHRLYRRYARASQQQNAVDAERLHALRIHAKKLRYSAEFFACLYDTKKAKSFLAALGEVQETLGQINDIAVAHRLLENLAANLSEHHEVIAFVRGDIYKELSKKIKMLRKTIHVFNKERTFWKK